MPEFRPKSQLNIGAAPQHRVDGLAGDIANLFGAVGKGIQTYDTIGENAAMLEYRSLSTEVSTNMKRLQEASANLADDDLEGHQTVYTQMEMERTKFADKLSTFKGHKAAYDAFANSSASGYASVDGAMAQYSPKIVKATELRNVQDVENTSMATGMMTPRNVFDSFQETLKVTMGAEKAKETSQDISFRDLYSNANDNKNSKTIPEERSTIVGSLGYATRDSVLKFFNKEILTDSELARLKIVKDENGVESFEIDGVYRPEQNAKLVAMAEFYLKQYSPDESGSVNDFARQSLHQNMKDSYVTIGADVPLSKEEAKFIELKTAYEELIKPNGEFWTVKETKQFNWAKDYTELLNHHSKRQAVEAAKASGMSVQEAEQNPIRYKEYNAAHILNQIKTGKPRKESLETTGLVTPSELKKSYGALKTEAVALWDSGDYLGAMEKEDKYMELTGEKGDLRNKLTIFESTGVSSATTGNDLAAMKVLVEHSHKLGNYPDMKMNAIVRAIDAAQKTLKEPNEKLGQNSIIAINDVLTSQASMRFENTDTGRKIIKGVKDGFMFGEYDVTSRTVSDAYYSMVGVDFNAYDDPEDIGSKIQDSLVQAIGDHIVPTIKYKGSPLDKKQLSVGMERWVKLYENENGIDVDTSEDTFKISMNEAKNGYVIEFKNSQDKWMKMPSPNAEVLIRYASLVKGQPMYEEVTSGTKEQKKKARKMAEDKGAF